MTPDAYMDLKEKVRAAGYAHEIDWAEELAPIQSSWRFFLEYIWVVVNSGMKEQIARKIYKRILDALEEDKMPPTVFGHKAKAQAMVEVLANLTDTFHKYRSIGSDEERIEFLQTLPWIGPITKYHLAKNLGITTVAKPDRHLARIAKGFKTTAQELCEQISRATGDTVALVDLVIWRAANLGFV